MWGGVYQRGAERSKVKRFGPFDRDSTENRVKTPRNRQESLRRAIEAADKVGSMTNLS